MNNIFNKEKEPTIVLRKNDIKKIAALMNFTIQEFADYLGVSRTYLSLANSGKEKLSKKLHLQIEEAFFKTLHENLENSDGIFNSMRRIFNCDSNAVLTEEELVQKISTLSRGTKIMQKTIDAYAQNMLPHDIINVLQRLNFLLSIRIPSNIK